MFVETAALAALTPDALKKAKAVLSLIRQLGNHNNELAAAAFREEADDIALDTAQGLVELERVVGVLMEMVIRPEDWQGHPEHEKPTAGDVTARAEQFALASVRAGSHGKRKILWNAFFSSFKPEHYRDGWSNHLWKIAEQVEYPECRWLAGRIREIGKRLERLRGMDPRDHDKDVLSDVVANDEEHFLVRRLEQLGLVEFESAGPEVPYDTEVGRRFMRFVWEEELWGDEKPTG